MDYLNHGTCSGACGADTRFKFGELNVTSLDKVYPPSEPALADY